MALDEALSARPEKMFIVELSTGEKLEAQFNPAELRKSIGVNWSRLAAPGSGRNILHFNSTGNLKIPIELSFDALAFGEDGQAKILDVEAYLHSLCYPVASGDVQFGGPPQILLVWPLTLSLTCIVATCETRYTAFARTGAPIRMVAKLMVEEDSDESFISDQIRQFGMRR